MAFVKSYKFVMLFLMAAIMPFIVGASPIINISAILFKYRPNMAVFQKPNSYGP